MKLDVGWIHKNFTNPLLAWHKLYGRHDLPWQNPKTAYRVWISEVMLQQTQVKTVVPYFLKFVARFPEIQDLAKASEDEVLTLWSGLGYYSRARNIHKTAQIVCEQYSGKIPQEISLLKSFPGIGDSTAAAIASLVFHQPTAITDGNVKRVLSRYFDIRDPIEKSQTQKIISSLAQKCMPTTQCADYSQAIMDLGATCCTPKKTQCNVCPVQKTCLAWKKGIVYERPVKTPKKNKPLKSKRFYLLFDKQHKLLLIKRPSNGIWGGLWCLPSDDDTYLFRLFSTQLNSDDNNMPPFEYKSTVRHTFTHYHLYMLIYMVKINSCSACFKNQEGQKWAFKDEILSLGLPTPIRMLIDQFPKSC